MRKGRIVIGVVIIIISCGIYLYPTFEKMIFNNETEKIMEVYETPEPSNGAEGEKPFQKLYDEMLAYNESLYTQGQTLKDCWSYEQNPVHMENMPSDDDVIGYITIPDMDVELPLLLGASTENMKRGAAVMTETSLPIGGINTNCVIAGHRGYQGLPYFRNIENMQVGSKVYITNPWGTLEYVVTGSKIISPHDDDSIRIQEGKDMVTLLTCHPYMSHGKYRYVVYCERVGTETVETERMEPEIGEGVDVAGLESEKNLSKYIIWFEDALRVIIPVVGGILVVACIVQNRRKK